MTHALDLQDPRAVEILALEHQRQGAYLSRDFKQLEPLFADELRYVHSTGKVDDRVTYLANVVGVPEFLSIERPDLSLQFIGDGSAVLSGPLNTHTRRADGEEAHTENFLTQVWARQAGQWRQVLYQLTRIQA